MLQRVAVSKGIAAHGSDRCCDVDGHQSVAVIETIGRQRSQLLFESDMLDRKIVESESRKPLYRGADIDICQGRTSLEWVVVVGSAGIICVTGVTIVSIPFEVRHVLHVPVEGVESGAVLEYSFIQR